MKVPKRFTGLKLKARDVKALRRIKSGKKLSARLWRRVLGTGLQAALADNARPGGERKLDSVEEAAIVALVCGPPREGNARWTIRLMTAEVMKRGIVEQVGRETIRVTLASHELKPWRDKNGVRAGDRSRVRRAHGRRAAAVRAPV